MPLNALPVPHLNSAACVRLQVAASNRRAVLIPPKVEKQLRQSFEFETVTVTVNVLGQFIKREPGCSAHQEIEDLGNGVILEMVYVPDGKFLMGANESEQASSDRERPQHQVTIQPFLMGKYPVTQAQWQAVASLPKVNLDLNPNPSHFKGANRPVECVSWHDAVEFCARLAKKTGRNYRLPSEAEWEYACRAGTTTPFYFGETITTEVANYSGNYTYGNAPKGKYRRETTSVGSFPPNAFGLYDMHGNVWEWCADHWHVNYQGAPIDGTAWLSSNKNSERMLRGGSWTYTPSDCRSANRCGAFPACRERFFGVRVVCGAAART